jgi:eukaryotic-like serine/threonine-protein kinase
MKLTPEQLSQVSCLVNIALDLPATERSVWARSQLPISTEPAVRRALEAMFSGDGNHTQFTFAPQPAVAKARRIQAQPGDVVDTYRLIEKIGSGGMGDVWLAERADGAITRRVALKLPHLHQATSLNAHLSLRHSREREILSGLNHPNIARLFDVGTATVGGVSVPYLALEYVAGESITHYCDARKLDVFARLKLVEQLLAAMGAAHRNLVVHRDIKPNNILVDASGQVKLTLALPSQWVRLRMRQAYPHR